MKEPLKQLDPPLSLEDFQPIEVKAEPKKLRELIDGLRALANVADMRVIAAIAEFDRIAKVYELVETRRARITAMAEQIATRRSPQLLAMVRTGVIPPELLNEVAGLVMPPDPDCDCERCRAHFGKEPISMSPDGQPLHQHDLN